MRKRIKLTIHSNICSAIFFFHLFIGYIDTMNNYIVNIDMMDHSQYLCLEGNKQRFRSTSHVPQSITYDHTMSIHIYKHMNLYIHMMCLHIRHRNHIFQLNDFLRWKFRFLIRQQKEMFFDLTYRYIDKLLALFYVSISFFFLLLLEWNL